MKHFYKNYNFGENWFDFEDLYTSFVNICPDGGKILEIGSWKGS